MAKQINKGERIEGVMVGDGWTDAERETRIAGATQEDVDYKRAMDALLESTKDED